MVAIDLFAGPGGWDLAARALGFDPLGVEWDKAACATRAAAGLWTIEADVAALDARAVLEEFFDSALLELLIASPPCQAFSMAGKGAGRRALAAYLDAIGVMADGGKVDRGALDAACSDPRGHLVLEPLRWALELGPRAVCCEQVEPVLPLWEAMSAALGQHGYRTWTGVCSAERYGTPQTRRRAILMASLDRQPQQPPASHQRYVPPRVKARQGESLFAAPEPERIVLPEDRGLLPWVSMAQALGWARDDRVGFPRRADTPSNLAGDGRVEIDGVEYRERDLRDASEPALAITEKSRSWGRWHYRNGNQEHAAKRAADEPAPRVHFGHAARWRAGQVVDTGCTRSGAQPDGGRARGEDEPAAPVTSRADQLERRSPVTEPAPAISAVPSQSHWVTERPATTVAGDPRVFPPGHKINQDDVDAGRGGQRRSGAGWTDGRPAPTIVGGRRSDEGMIVGRQLPAGEDQSVGGWSDVEGAPRNSGKAVRVSIEEASVLQGMPADYPWRGSRTAQYRQVGDLIPPQLALAVLRGLL